jgi:hypothetical protein
MKKLLLVVVFLITAPSCFAQLTQEQKVTDFKALAGLYDKNYGPYEWKKQVFGFDLLRIQPWLDEVRDSRSDLAFYDICVRYVASLHDSHDEFILPSIYEAFLPITADIYDGKVLIDFVDTFSLDPATFPINVGDELISVNGIGMDTWINVLGAYSVNGNGNHGHHSGPLPGLVHLRQQNPARRYRHHRAQERGQQQALYFRHPLANHFPSAA